MKLKLKSTNKKLKKISKPKSKIKLKYKKQGHQPKKNKVTNKTRHMIAYILCKNNQIKEYHTDATRKFNLEDETYVVKGSCCYRKKINGIYEQVSYYVQGNPNPFDLRKIEKNVGLSCEELDSFIDADLFNILIECQQNDKSKYVLGLVVLIFVLNFVNFISMFF